MFNYYSSESLKAQDLLFAINYLIIDVNVPVSHLNYCILSFGSQSSVNAGMQGFEHHNHDLYGIQAGMEILGMPVRLRSSHHHQLADSFLHKNYTVQAEEAAASMFSGDGTLSLFNVKQSDPLEHSFVGFHLQQPPLGLRNSKYWRPAQDLLKEFCNLIDESSSAKRPSKRHEEEGKANNSWCQSMHLLELQKMRARLVSMLEEVSSIRSIISIFFIRLIN